MTDEHFEEMMKPFDDLAPIDDKEGRFFIEKSREEKIPERFPDPADLLGFDKIQNICENNGCDCNGATVINEDWIVTKVGDILSTKRGYGIYDNQLKKDDWLKHMAGKCWVNFNTFLPAYFEALRRKGLKTIKIRIDY